MNKDAMIEAEKTDLATHVELCAMRNIEMREAVKRVEYAVYAIILLLVGGGYVTLDKVLPIARALAAAAG